MPTIAVKLNDASYVLIPIERSPDYEMILPDIEPLINIINIIKDQYPSHEFVAFRANNIAYESVCELKCVKIGPYTSQIPIDIDQVPSDILKHIYKLTNNTSELKTMRRIAKGKPEKKPLKEWLETILKPKIKVIEDKWRANMHDMPNETYLEYKALVKKYNRYHKMSKIEIK